MTETGFFVRDLIVGNKKIFMTMAVSTTNNSILTLNTIKGKESIYSKSLEQVKKKSNRIELY